MKTMTKLLSVLLMLAMLFTLAACTVIPNIPNTGDNNGDNGNDNGDNTGDNGEGENKALYAEMADKFVTGALTQLEAAKSVKFTINVDFENSEDYTDDVYDISGHRVGVAEITVSEINGKLAFSANMVTKTNVEGEVPEGFEDAKWLVQVNEVIQKDGSHYERIYAYYDSFSAAEIDEIKAASRWERTADESGLTDISFSELIAALKAESAEYQTKLDEIKASFKAFIAEELEKGGISDGKLEWSYDAAPDVTAVMNYLHGLTANDNLAKVINDALAAMKIEMTVDALIANVIAYGDKTVAEVIAEADAALAENGLGNFQEAWDKIVASDAFDMIAADMPEEVKAQLAAVKISDIVEQFGQYTVADVIYTMLAAQNSEPEYGGDDEGIGEFEECSGDEFDGDFEEIEPMAPILTAPEGFLEAMLAEYTPMLYVTFGELGTDIFEIIYSIFQIDIDYDITARKLAAGLGFEFDTENGSMKGITFGFDIDAYITEDMCGDEEHDTDCEDDVRVTSFNVKIDVAVDEISGTAAVINAPDDSMVDDAEEAE